jgi:hypothetical protein
MESLVGFGQEISLESSVDRTTSEMAGARGVVSLASQHQDLLKKGAALSIASLGGLYVLCRMQSDHILEDIGDIVHLLKIRQALKRVESSPRWTVVDMFLQNLVHNADGDALSFIGEKDKPAETYTFRQLDHASNRGRFSFIVHESIFLTFMSSGELGPRGRDSSGGRCWSDHGQPP